MKKILLVLCPIVLIAIAILYAVSVNGQTTKTSTHQYEHYYTADEYYIPTEDHAISFDTIPESVSGASLNYSNIDKESQVDLDPDSITVLVNKQYTLDENYEPMDLVVPNIKFSFSAYDPKMQLRQEAATAIENLFNAAKQEGLQLAGVSGYRSYKRQFQIYASNLIRRGTEFTNQYSAMAGASEHQTGLAMDISTASINYRLSDSFATTPEGIWVSNNCHKYGFIVRFPEDKTHVTGYSYEPWHIRYVGVELATYLTEKNLSLDEYYGYVYDDQIYANVDYDAIIKQYYDMKGITSNSSTANTPSTQKPATDDVIDDFESLEDDLIESEDDLDTEEPDTNTEPSSKPEESPSDSVITTPSEKPNKPNQKPDKPTPTPTEPPKEEEVPPTITPTPEEDKTEPPTQAPTTPPATEDSQPESTPMPTPGGDNTEGSVTTIPEATDNTVTPTVAIDDSH